ncbi:MAG: N-acyl-D-amino-acid deacylase [Myxococcota bacterium]|jgi:N-acyl-D-amino-acid deacylase
MHDLVIRGGTIVDGTGAPRFTGDVAIDGGIITAVGAAGSARREIAADGLLVTPGFVDMHTHYDGQVTWDPYLTPSSWHGVTSVVMGNCGVGFAPAAPDKHSWLIGLMEGVEDIPGAALHEGIKWGWESFPEYMTAIGASPHAIDFATQIPHGALRAYVMGERGANNDDATSADIQAMHALVAEALNAGALGFSTSRTMLHKSIDGVPVPGTFAARDELFGIGRALRDTGKGVFQLAAEHSRVPEELEWMQALSLEIGRPVMFNLSQTDQAPELWRAGLAGLEAAAAAGAQVYAQVAGRAIGVVMSFHLTAHPFATRPSFMRLADASPEDRRAAINSAEFRAKVMAEEPVYIGDFETFVTTSFDKMFPLGAEVNYEPDPADSVAGIAQRTGRTPEDVAWDMLAEHDTEGMLYFPLFNYAEGNLDMLHELHQHPRTRMGLSDAGAHCGAICDGGMPTFMLTHWTRDRKRGPLLSVEHIIRRQTSETAQTFGLHDRGILAPGYKADVNVIDYDNLRFGRPEVARDLPAGGRRVLQRASGYVSTIVSGTPIVDAGAQTGELPGALIRGAKTTPKG